MATMAAIAAIAAIGAEPAAVAAPACGAGGPWVLMQVRASDWSAAQRASVFDDLRQTFAAEAIEVCFGDPDPGVPPALATLTIDVGPDSKGSVDIEVRDAVTHKWVRRDLDLTRIPADGRAAAIAIEIDELLRASWAELALDTARARAAAPRQEAVARTVSHAFAARDARRPALGARAAAELYLGGTALLGADVVGRLPLGSRVDLDLALGGRGSRATGAAHGNVRAVAAGGALGLSLRIAGQRRASLDAGGALAVSWIEYRADPAPGAQSSPYGGWLVAARLRLIGRVAVGDWVHLTAGLTGGAALRGVEATDTGRVVTAARGVELGTLVGLEVP